MRRSIPLLLATVLAALVLPGRSGAAPIPAGATWTQTYLASKDGTMLRADVLLPKNRSASDRHPVILSIGPYFGRNAMNGGAGTGPVSRFYDLLNEGNVFARGYAYVQVDSRGYGGSDGCNDFGGPGEQSDAESAVNWAARQPWSNGNVGMWGKSYDAWTQVMALAEGTVGLKAAVIQAPLIETYRGMFMNGVHFDSGWYGTPSLYAGLDLAPTWAGDRTPEEVLYPAKGTATNPHCYAENLAMTPLPDHELPYWQRRDIIADASRSTVPVLWSHGFNDINTKPHNFLPVYSRLQGPKRAWIGQWDHVRGNQSNLVGRNGFMTEAMAWFDRYLKNAPAASYPAVEVQNGEGWWRSEEAWPPADAERYSVELRPGTYVDDLRDYAARGQTEVLTFSQALPYDVHFAGEPLVTVRATPQVPNANMIVVLYDVGPDGDARMITRGASLVRGPHTWTFDLFPQDWILRAGHRLGVSVTDDNELFMPTPTSGTVEVHGASVSLPFLRYRRTSNLAGGRASAMDHVAVTLFDADVINAFTKPASLPPPLLQQ